MPKDAVMGDVIGDRYAQNRGLCFRHGASVKRCSAEGCTNQATKGGYCVSHGAIAKRCSVEGCTKQARNGGVCISHGLNMSHRAKRKRCSVEGCTNQAQKGGVCISHGAICNRCSVEGCNNHVVEGGVCISHDAKLKRCKCGGCSTNAHKGGFCFRHAPKEQCSYEVCDNIAYVRGCCRKHANSNNHSKESNSSTTNNVDSDHQPQNGEQEGPLVCLPAVKRVNKASNHCVTQDQAATNREDDTTYYASGYLCDLSHPPSTYLCGTAAWDKQYDTYLPRGTSDYNTCGIVIDTILTHTHYILK